MDEFLEIIIHDDSASLINWIENFQPEVGKELILVKEVNAPDLTKNEQEIVFDDVFLRICGTPKKEIIMGDVCFMISTISGPKEMVEKDEGYHQDFYILTATNLDNNFTKLIINTNQNDIEPYLNEFLRKIQENWPESKRYLLNKRISPYPLKKNPLVFDLIINGDPKVFLDWVEPKLNKLMEPRFILSEANHIYDSTVFGMEVFYPNKFNGCYELYCLLETRVNLKEVATEEYKFVEDIPEWVSIQLKLKPKTHDKFSLKCYLFPHDPHFDAIAEELESLIRISFVNKISEMQNEVAEKHEKENWTENDKISDKRNDVYIPKNKIQLRKWKAAWKIIEDDWKENADINQCSALLGLKPQLYFSDYTLRSIIKAGELGLLDEE